MRLSDSVRLGLHLRRMFSAAFEISDFLPADERNDRGPKPWRRLQRLGAAPLDRFASRSQRAARGDVRICKSSKKFTPVSRYRALHRRDMDDVVGSFDNDRHNTPQPLPGRVLKTS